MLKALFHYLMWVAFILEWSKHRVWHFLFPPSVCSKGTVALTSVLLICQLILCLDMRFHNVNKLIRFRWTHEAVLIDEDGTLLKGNKGRRILVPHTDIMDPQSCQVNFDSNFSFYIVRNFFPQLDFHKLTYEYIHNNIWQVMRREVAEQCILLFHSKQTC